MLAQYLKPFPKIGVGGFTFDRLAGFALHGADDGRSSQLGGAIDNRFNEIDRPLPHDLVFVGQLQTVLDPASTSAHGSHRQAVVRQVFCQEQMSQSICIWRKDFDRVKAQLVGLRNGILCIAPKHEWTASCLFDQGKRNCRLHRNHSFADWERDYCVRSKERDCGHLPFAANSVAYG